jgi:hypothetical protein
VPTGVEDHAVVSTTEGVIVGVTPDEVLVKLRNSDAVVHFPRVLFEGTGFVQHGAPVSYLIRQRPDGIRYQDFAPGASTGTPEQLVELDSVLGEIKYRTR